MQQNVFIQKKGISIQSLSSPCRIYSQNIDSFTFNYFQACQDLGGIMVEPRTDAQRNKLTQILYLLYPTIPADGNLWIGLIDQAEEGVFRWFLVSRKNSKNRKTFQDFSGLAIQG